MEEFGLLELESGRLESIKPTTETVTVVFIHGINGHRIRSWKSLGDDEENDEGEEESDNESQEEDSDDDWDAFDDSEPEGSDGKKTPDPEEEQEKAPEIDGENPNERKAHEEKPSGKDVTDGDRPPSPADEGKVGEAAKESEKEEQDEEAEEEGGEEETMWPADLLPTKFPTARILTYGYDCGSETSAPQDLMSRTWIQQVARNLLDALIADTFTSEEDENGEGEGKGEEKEAEGDDEAEGNAETQEEDENGESEAAGSEEEEEEDEEEEEESETGEEEDEVDLSDATPLVFVCHDLGGVILKEMLWLANNERAYLPIAVRTQSLIFFGTPHQESPSITWEDLVFDCALASTEARRETRRHLMTAIVKNGAAGVRDVSERFNQLAGQYKILNIFGTEKNPTTGSVVVPEPCAIWTGSGGQQLPFEEHIQRDETHLALCHFEEDEDPALEKVYERIGAATAKRCAATFEVRHTFSTRQPQRNWPLLPPTEAATIEWVTKNKSVTDWLAATSFGILHIHGEAGSGKTVFAATLEKYLQENEGSTAVISYSFDRSSYCGRSFGNMLESLIRELLSQSPAVDAALAAIHTQITSSETRDIMWTEEALCLVFSAAVDCFQYPILCIIDGVQDCDETRSDMLQFMAMLARDRTGEPFKLAITTREEAFTESLGTDLESLGLEKVPLFMVDLDDEEIVHDERHRIIQSRLTKFLATATTPIGPEDIKNVMEKFCSLSLTFLEVEFIIKKFQAQPPSVASVLKFGNFLAMLAETEAPLHTIYEQHLAFDVGTQDEWAIIEQILPWLVYAEQPLTINQLGVVQNLEENIDSFSSVALENVRSKDITDILQRTLGSLIVIDGDKVVFAHETVEDFLEQHPKLSANVGDAAKVHARIASKCLQYLANEELEKHQSFVEDSKNTANAKLELPESSWGVYEFLTYAAHHWPTHYKHGQASEEGSEDLFQRFLKFAESKRGLIWWQELFYFLETDSLVSKVAERVKSEELQYSQLKMASFFGLETLVQELLDKGVEEEFVPVGEELRSCMEVAAWNDHAEVIKTLYKYCRKLVASDWDPDDDSALKAACWAGNANIVKILVNENPKAGLDQCLQIASGAGHPRVVQLLAEAGADVNTKDSTNKTPLHYGAESGYSEVIMQLLSLGADLSAADDDGYTALHFAAMKGHRATVRVLLAQPGSDINTKQWSIKPLHLAATNGHVALVKELLSQDPPADATAANAEGSTALHMAARGGYSQTVKLLLGIGGADATATTKNGLTPLHCAAESSPKIADMLLNMGADPDAPTYDTRRRPLHIAAENSQTSIVRKLLDCGATVDPVTQDSKLTPLLFAAYAQSVEIVQMLLDAGANPHVKAGPWHKDCEGMTALHLAWGHIGVVEALMQVSKDEAKCVDLTGHTPFFYAFAARSLEACRLLLKEEPSGVTEPDHDNWLPLHNATASGSVELMDLLLEHGAEIDEVVKGTESTPVFIAARHGHVKALKLLIDKGADFRKADTDLWTPLHTAAAFSNNKFQCVKLLVDAGADVNSADDEEWRVIHKLAVDGTADTIKYVLDHGADITARDKNQRTPLQFAVGNGRLEAMKVLIEAGDDVNTADSTGGTPLHRAAKLTTGDGNGDAVDCIMLLLEKGAQVDARDDDGWTALHFAAAMTELANVKALVEAGADVNAADNNRWTPIHRASSSECGGGEACLSYLTENGADVNARDEDDWTPLHFAATRRDLPSIKALVEAGADVNAVDNDGWTPLHRSAISGEEDAVGCISYLVEKGANVSAREEDGWTAMHLAAQENNLDSIKVLVEAGADVNVVDNMGWTPLHRSSGSSDSAECVKYLMDHGATVDAREEDDWTPLHLSAETCVLELLKIFIAAGADVNAVDNTSVTPLLRAMLSDDPESEEQRHECVKYLLQQGAGIHVRDKDGVTALHSAAGLGYLDIMKTLIEGGADVNAVNNHGWTSLHQASRGGHVECVRYLLENGADIQARDDDGWSPLHAASWGENVDVLRVLLENGSQLDEVDSKLMTALHGTVSAGYLEGTRFLLEQGANIEYRTELGDTPLAQATELGNVEIMRLLIEKGADINTRNHNGNTLMRMAMAVKDESRGKEVLEVLSNAGLLLDLDDRDIAGRTYLFTSAAAGAVGQTQMLLDKGIDKDAVDEVGRTALDVCLIPEVRALLGGDPAQEENIDRTCATLADGENLARQAFCDVCMGEAMINEFFYHCCAGDCLSPADGAFVACVACYENGGRCKSPSEHTMLLRYIGHSMESLEEYSPWVKTLKVPKDLDA